MIQPVIKQIDQAFSDQMKYISKDWGELPRGVTPNQEIKRFGNMTLRKFGSNDSPISNRRPLLIIPSLINRWYILDLTAETSYIKHFSQSFDVYLTDWGYPGAESGHFPLSYYYHKQIKRAIREIKKISGQKKIDLLGYCLGGTMAYCYSCLEPDEIENLILLTSPIDFSDTGVLGLYAEHFPQQEFLEALDYMPGWLLANSFQFIQPWGSAAKLKTFHKKITDERFKYLFVAMERWISDPVNFPIKAYTELIEELYQQNRLFKGELYTDQNVLVNPALRNSNCLILTAAKDHISPPQASRLPDSDKSKVIHKTLNSGHIGITTGRASAEARTEILKFLSDKI